MHLRSDFKRTSRLQSELDRARHNQHLMTLPVGGYRLLVWPRKQTYYGRLNDLYVGILFCICKALYFERSVSVYRVYGMYTC